MAIVSCTSCGAQIDDTSRFCRGCGRPFDPSEITTRKLEPGVEFHAPTQPVNQWPTTPAYVSPVQVPIVPATNDLAPASKNRTVIVLLAATVGLLLFLLFAVFLVKFNSGSLAPPPTPTQTGIPVPPPAPNAPVAPPVPPAVTESAFDASLKYPGAEEVMNIKNAKGGVLHLQTKDSIKKVLEWYTDKLKPTDTVNLPFGNAIMHSGDIGVVISGNDSGTSILITRGDQ